MPWDARSRRVFLEIPDKSWYCYLAFDSFPCMEAESSWFFLCSALAQPVLGEGLTPRHHYTKKAQLELCTSLPRSRGAPVVGPQQPAPDPRVLAACGTAAAGTSRGPWDRWVQELLGSGSGLSSPTPQPPHPGRREERSCPTPAPIHGQQPGLIHLSPSLKRPALALGCTGEYDYAHFID